jgi:hypothetical protein
MASLVLNGSTSGSVTLSSPAVSGTTTLTLPTQSGTVITTGSTFAGTGPAFSAYLGSNQSITTSTFTKVQCNTEEFDTNSNYDNATNYRFTPTVAGYYQISGCINFSSTTKVEFLTSIFKNGSEFKRGVYINIPTTTNSNNCPVSALVYFNGTTDYVELYGYLNGSGSLVFSGTQYNVYFQGVMVRGA